MPEGIGYLPGTRRLVDETGVVDQSGKPKKKKKKKKKAAGDTVPPPNAAKVARNKELAKDVTNPTHGMTQAEAAAFFAKKRALGLRRQ